MTTIQSHSILDRPTVATDFLEKIHCLKHLLSRDLIACDAKWTIFVSAALSYRYESQLKPFPPRFENEQGGCNIETLAAIINETPKLKIVLKNLIDENYDELDTEVVELLYWVLVTLRDSYLRSVDEEEYDSIMSKIPQKSDAICPSHIFALCPTTNSKSEEVFQNEKANFPSKFAFHGSKLDCFYSIINHGLHQHMCKNGLFGEGVYLSSELSVSMNYSPFGAGWGASNCGAMLSCVALCEYVENPNHVKFKVDEKHKTDIPNTYIVITNNDVVRVRYLLFYGRQFPDENSTRSVIIDWVSRNRYTLSLVCYTLFLASIGLANSGNGMYLRHVITKQAKYAMGVVKKLLLGDT